MNVIRIPVPGGLIEIRSAQPVPSAAYTHVARIAGIAQAWRDEEHQ